MLIRNTMKIRPEFVSYKIGLFRQTPSLTFLIYGYPLYYGQNSDKNKFFTHLSDLKLLTVHYCI